MSNVLLSITAHASALRESQSVASSVHVPDYELGDKSTTGGEEEDRRITLAGFADTLVTTARFIKAAVTSILTETLPYRQDHRRIYKGSASVSSAVKHSQIVKTS